MSAKQGVSEDADDVALHGPRDTANARLPAPQSPAVQPAPPSPQRLLAMLSGTTRSTFAAVAAAWQAIDSEAIPGDE